MSLDVTSAVLVAAQFGYRRYGIKGALLFGGGVAGLIYLWRRRKATAE